MAKDEDRPFSLDDIRFSEKIKESKPKIKDLQNLVTPNYASCWKEIGIQLGMPVGLLNSIERVYPTYPVLCCNNMWICWCEFDIDASWNKVIKAIDSPAITTMNKSFSCVSVSSPSTVNKELEAVLDLSCRLKIMSLKNRYKIESDIWPLTSPKHFTSVALIHHKGEQTKREVLAIANLQKRGNFDLDEIYCGDEYFKQSQCTKNISDIFREVKYADGTTKCPGIILIEGVPGIGKTILSKEIVFQWANGTLLSDKILVFLVYLRDTESHKINSLESLVNYVSYPEVAQHVLKYITDSKGKSIAIVFDGYDELSEEIRKKSFLYDLMTQKNIRIPFCKVVITSRPTVSSHLHDIIDLRVEILGFTNEDKKAYIVDALNGNKNKVDLLMTYLNNNPAIDAYCYIPLNMTILLSFFKTNDFTNITELPKTQTEVNEKFICATISRYIRKINGLELKFSKFSEVEVPCDYYQEGIPCTGHKKIVPVGKILKEMSKLAFKALEKDKIVFTTVELHEACPCLESQSENLNGLGLLKAVQFLSFDDNRRNVSFNFLHFTIQEILAAHHITQMSKKDQIKYMKETFWNNRYYNTWIMYVGLTKNQLSITFKHFLSGNWLILSTHFRDWWNKGAYCQIKKDFVNDKVKCLYLFQCFSEAENDDLCQYVGKLLQENKIDISNQTLSAMNLYTLSLFLTRCTTKEWNSLNLSKCFIGDNGIEQLYKSFTSNNRGKVSIDVLNISENYLTQSSVEFVARLLLEWNVKKLTVSLNDINLNFLNEMVMYQFMEQSMQLNTKVCNINESRTFFIRLSKLEYLSFALNLDSEKSLATLTELQAKITDNIKLEKIFDVLKSNISLEYLSFGAVAKLTELEAKNITIKLEKIFDVLKSNRSLRYVDMSLITIESNILKDVIAIMENNIMLKELKVTKVLLGQDDFQCLRKHIIKFKGLKHLSINGCRFCDQDEDKIKTAIMKNYNQLELLDLSYCKMSDWMINKLLITFPQLVRLKWLNLRKDPLLSNEVGHIFSGLKKLKLLQCVDLTGNDMAIFSVNDIEAMIINNAQLQILCLPRCALNQTDLRIIIQAMQNVSSLQYVDFSKSKIDDEVASDIAVLLAKNSKLEQIHLTALMLRQNGFQLLKTNLAKFKGLKHFRIINCTFTNQDVVYLETVISSNHNIKKSVISHCKIIGQKVITMRDNTGIYDQLEELELSNNSAMNSFMCNWLNSLSYNSQLKKINLCNCLLNSDEMKQILMILKHLKYLEIVDLRGNAMASYLDSEMKAMIVNNKHLQRLCLPRWIHNETSLRTIIQAMQKVSSLDYVDFGENRIDNDLASDVETLINNDRLSELKIAELELQPSGFKHLNTHLKKITGLKCFKSTSCSFTELDVVNLTTAFHNNPELEKLDLSYSKPFHTLCIFSVLNNLSSLKCLNLNWITITDQIKHKIIKLINNNSNLEHLEMAGCNLSHNFITFISCENLMHLNLSCNNDISKGIHQLLFILSCNPKLKWLELSNCQLKSRECKELFETLKSLRYLQCIDLSANKMTDNVASVVAAMIINNKEIQKLILPDCILSQASLTIIIQAMQTISSLQYVDLRANKVDNELAKDLSILCANNTNLRHLKFARLRLDQNGFNYLRRYVGIFHGIKYFSINDCSFTDWDVSNMAITIGNNTKIKELDLSNCNILYKMQIFNVLKTSLFLQCLKVNNVVITNQMEDEVITIISNNSKLKHLEMAGCGMSKKLYVNVITCTHFSNFSSLNFSHNNIVSREIRQLLPILSSHTKLKSLDLSHCELYSNEINEIFNVLKKMKQLQCVILSGNIMTNNDANEVAAMIINNENIQKLFLPNCVLTHASLIIIIQAMQAVSSLQYVDFNKNKIDDELASDVAIAIAKNTELLQMKFAKLELNQGGFMYLKAHLMIFRGIKHFKNIFCTFTDQDVANLATAIVDNNPEIEDLDLSYSKAICGAKMLYIFFKLKTLSSLKCLKLNNVTITDQMEHEILAVIRNNSTLECLEMSGCNVSSSFITTIQCIKNLQVVM